MIRLPEFAYVPARTVAEAARAMRDHGSAAMLVAGGTDLFPNMKRRQFEPTTLVGLRGIREIVRAMESVSQECRLQLAGSFGQLSVEQEVTTYAGWSRVEAHGYLDRDGVRRVMGDSLAGLVTLHPVINYLDALPVKMFEYMSAGVAVIASDFPLWREIVVGNDCGLCVDPLDPRAIAEAIDFLVANPVRAREMGANGQRAVAQRYNWQQEERKLLDTYRALAR